ncbi:MAG: TatD family hydrolase [Planctomycetaceae bacterium]|nr:TatD family hydrolase [Planctomycetaceae bacterium]
MFLIDTHAHLDEQSLAPDRVELLDRAQTAGVGHIITIGVSASSSQAAIALAEQYPQVSAVVGVHPNYCSQAAPHDFDTIEELVAHPQVVGIGETGLDKYWDFAPFELQQEYFERHVRLSQLTGKPFVVHCRDAEVEATQLLQRLAQEAPLQGVMHSFCGSSETARLGLDLGLFFSFAGMLTYKKNADLREVARSIPLDRILVETDSPYLAPVPMRGKRNEPAHVVHTARCLAELHDLTIEEIAEITTNNARRLFPLPT